MAAISFTLNGAACSEAAELDQPLLFYLRNRHGLTGTKYGCGQGLCGACRVLVDGRAVNACDTPLWSLDGAAVVTVEGLAPADRLHPVQRALVDARAGQCGFCMPGIAVTLAAALAANPEASRAELVEALEPHLCRCGSHARILRAVDHLAGRGRELSP